MGTELDRKEFFDSAAAKMNNKDPINAYLDEIGRIPLLSAKDEAEIFRTISQGGSEGAAAREKAIKANLRYVVHIAQRYTGHGLSLSDLVQEGNLGLIRAVDRFNVNLGNRFSTYATWWIKESIITAITERGRAIRLPSNLVERAISVRRAVRIASQKLGYMPTLTEIAEITKENVDFIEFSLFALNDLASLDTPVGENGENTIGDFIQDKKENNPETIVLNAEISKRVHKLLDILTDRERDVIEKRFGFNGQEVMTLEEIGKEYGLTRERIRQIEDSALHKLKHPKRKRQLMDCMDL